MVTITVYERVPMVPAPSITGVPWLMLTLITWLPVHATLIGIDALWPIGAVIRRVSVPLSLRAST